MRIRPAEPDDAAAACQVLRRSITELCQADHRDDPAILDRWLANKTPAIVATWITNPNNAMLLAVDGTDILAVGAVTCSGEIILNYVSPDARFRGVSRGLMAALEAQARQWGNSRCSLLSTQTARRFYQASGYVQTGPAVGKFGSDVSYPMSKLLPPQDPAEATASG